MDKQKAITEAGRSINEAVAEALHLSSDSDITTLWRNVMNPQQRDLLDLALFCESEMLRTMQTGAHFSSCLMGAAMNEALMALMCLLFEKDVRTSRQFYHSTKDRKGITYFEVISNWSLQHFINVAEQCAWIPPTIVDADFVTALADGFRELMPMTHPELSEEQIESGAASFFLAPGPAMLRMTQELRNAIHAGSWMRRTSTFNSEPFVGWCQFAAVLCGEIRLCLLHHLMAQMGNLARSQAEKLKELLSVLPPEVVPLIEDAMKSHLNIPTFSIDDIGKIVEALNTAHPEAIENTSL